MTRPRLRGRPGRSVTPRGERTRERSPAAHPGRGGGPPGRERAGRPARRPRVRCAARRPVGRAGVGSSRARPAPTPSAVITAPDPAEESAACPVPRRRGAWCRTHGSLGDAAPRRARHRAPDQLAGPVPLTPAEGSTSTPSCSRSPGCSPARNEPHDPNSTTATESTTGRRRRVSDPVPTGSTTARRDHARARSADDETFPPARRGRGVTGYRGPAVARPMRRPEPKNLAASPRRQLSRNHHGPTVSASGRSGRPPSGSRAGWRRVTPPGGCEPGTQSAPPG
jgi:hypothetical protein